MADGKTHEILISDVIGGTIYGIDIGVTAHQIKRELDAAGDADVLVRINSPGGSAFEAAAIFNLLKDHQADISIDGMAASAAGIIAMAGRKVTMARNAILMIHDPWAALAGDARHLRKSADTLDKVKGTIIDSYRQRSSLSESQLSKMMSEETWFTADEAKAAGFVDEIGSPVRVQNRFDLSAFGYKHPPESKPTPVLDKARARQIAITA